MQDTVSYTVDSFLLTRRSEQEYKCYAFSFQENEQYETLELFYYSFFGPLFFFFFAAIFFFLSTEKKGQKLGSAQRAMRKK